jgi:hypothetical protein
MTKYEQYAFLTFPGLIHTVSLFLTCSSVQKTSTGIFTQPTDSVFVVESKDWLSHIL